MLTSDEKVAFNRKVFIAALRSKRYKQMRHSMHRFDKFCVLGVAADLFGTGWHGSPEFVMFQVPEGTQWEFSAVLPPDVTDALGLFSNQGHRSDFQTSLVILNDHVKLSFSQIADKLEKNPDLWFKPLERG